MFILLDKQERLNELLIQEQYGEFVEEDYISNYNHLMRTSQRDSQMTNGKCDNFVDPMCKDYFMEANVIDIDPPPFEQSKRKQKLKGPFSSLSIQPHGLTEATRNAQVIIDKYSVNSVMLENDPQVSSIYDRYKLSCVHSILDGILFVTGYDGEVFGGCVYMLYRCE